MNNGEQWSNAFDALATRYQFIDVRVHCPGGSVFEGVVIYNAIKKCTAEVTIYIDGIAASMMSIVMLAAKNVLIARNAFVMIHAPSGSAGGTSADHFSIAKLLKSVEANFKRDYKEKTGLSDADVDKLMDGTDHWFSADECKAINLVNGIYDEVENTSAVFTPDKPGQVQTMYDRFAALAASAANPAAPVALNNQNIEMKELIITVFALAGLTKDSSDSAILAALKEKFDAATGLAASLKQKLDAAVNSQGDTLIAAAETAQGKPFDETQKANLKKLSAESLDALKMALSFITPTAAAAAPGAAAPAAPTALSLIAGESKTTPGASKIPADRAGWNWDQWCEKDEAGLKALGYDDQNIIYKASYKVDMPK